MSDEVEAPETPAATAPASAPEPTLEDVYKDAGVDLQPQQPAAPIAPERPAYTPPAQAAPHIPDPYDTDAHKAYLQQQALGIAQTQDAVRRLTGYLNQQQQREAHAALQADLKLAVDTVNEVVNHPKPKVVEAMLDAKAREDPRFKALWDNRARNPTAWTNALKAVSKEFAADLSVKVDPSLVAAQRARKIAQGQMATTDNPRNDTEEWESMTLAEQEDRYQRILNRSL